MVWLCDGDVDDGVVSGRKVVWWGEKCHQGLTPVKASDRAMMLVHWRGGEEVEGGGW